MISFGIPSDIGLSNHLARWLADAGFFVSTINPKLIKDYGNNTLRKVKTDEAENLLQK